MASERVSELLYDTASTLRLLDAELGELAPRSRPDITALATVASAVESASGDQPQVPEVFVAAMREVHAMLASIRSGREHIRSAATERLALTSERLDVVSSVTEHAARDIMDALERAVAKVDALESPDVLVNRDRSQVIRSDLREELYTVMSHMQFHDITSQQIMHVQSLLVEMETRLTDIASLFDRPASGRVDAGSYRGLPQRAAAPSLTFDPDATIANAEARQALADALVERGRGDD